VLPPQTWIQNKQDFAIALGVSKRTVEELEGTVNLNTPDSIERRQIIARLLRIPPALLALDWRFMVYEHNTEEPKDAFADIIPPRRKTPGFSHGDIRRAVRRRNTPPLHLFPRPARIHLF